MDLVKGKNFILLQKSSSTILNRYLFSLTIREGLGLNTIHHLSLALSSVKGKFFASSPFPISVQESFFPTQKELPHRDRAAGRKKSLMIGANKGEFLLIWSHLSLAIRLNQGEMERTFYSASFFAEEKRLVVLALKVLLSHFYGALKKADELQCSKLQILCSAD